MKNNLASFLLVCFFSTCTLQAQLPQICSDNICTQDVEVGRAYSVPNTIFPQKNYSFFGATNFIYWEPIQENMELGVVSDISDPLDFFNGTIEPLDFDFQPGFQLAAGMNFATDGWDSVLQYTWLGGSDTVEKSLDPNNLNVSLHPFWQFATLLNPQYCYGKENWSFTLQFLDWDLGRKIKSSPNFSLRPFTGLRFSFIDQKVNVKYKNYNESLLSIWPDTSIEQKSDGWGVGPRIGSFFDWFLGHGVKLIARGEMDISYFLYTKLYSKQQSTDPDIIPRTRYISNETDKGTLRTHFDLGLGFGWGDYFFKNKWHFDLQAEYSFQLFMSQNVFRNYTNVETISKSISSNGDLYLQGLTFSFRFDY